MCNERKIQTKDYKREELLQSIIAYNLLKSPSIIPTMVKEIRWWKDINGAGWMTLTLVQLHQIKYDDIKTYLYSRGHPLEAIEQLHSYEPMSIYNETWDSLMKTLGYDEKPTLQDEFERLFRTTLMVFKTMPRKQQDTYSLTMCDDSIPVDSTFIAFVKQPSGYHAE